MIFTKYRLRYWITANLIAISLRLLRKNSTVLNIYYIILFQYQYYLVAKYDHFFLDWDGVIYSGGSAIEGSIEAIKYLRENRKSLYFVTNTSSRSQIGMKQKFANIGIEIKLNEAIPSWLTVNINQKFWRN